MKFCLFITKFTENSSEADKDLKKIYFIILENRGIRIN